MIGLDVLFGGLTGLIGNVITGITNYKTKKLEAIHEEKMVELESAAMKLEAEMNIAINKAEIEGEVELADTAAYMESLKSGQTSLFGKEWIDKLFRVWLRGFMRPALTAYLVGMATVITFMAWKIIQEYGMQAMSADQAVQIFREVTSVIVYLAVSCVTWWFGDRTMSKYIMKKFNSKNKGE